MNKPTIVIQAPIATHSGYGEHSRDILKSLYELDNYDIKIVPTRWGNTPQNVIPDNEFGKWILQHIILKIEQKPDIFIQISVANEFNPIGNYNIGITAGVETTIIPKDFIDGANKMDLIIVPSNFTKEIFQRTAYQQKNKQTGQVINEFKITKPIEVLFEGVDIRTYLDHSMPVDITNLDNTLHSNVDILESIPEDFLFLFVGHWLKGNIGQDRKDVGMMLKTFCSVFKTLPAEKRPAIVLKTSQGGFSVLDRERVRKKIEHILKPLGDELPSIYFLHGDLSSNEMASLYNNPKVKAMISFTKGEGYGRPLCEFGLTGKPIIVSKWSGQLDFLPTEYTVFLDGELTNVHESAADKFILKESKWFTVDYSKAANSLLDVYKNYDLYLKKSKPLKKHIIDNFSLEKMKNELGMLLNKYVRIEPKVAEFKRPTLKLPKLKKIE